MSEATTDPKAAIWTAASCCACEKVLGPDTPVAVLDDARLACIPCAQKRGWRFARKVLR